MARAKKIVTEAEVTKVEAVEKEADFGDIELKINKPVLASDKTMVVGGNFEDLAGKITAIVNRYKGTQLTEENVGYVKTIKSHFTSLRTGIERERKEWKKAYITPVEKTLDAMCADLQTIIAEGENALTVQLEAFDQRRKDELTEVLKEYVAEAVEKHGLREEYASQIQLKDKYYNKTQNEEDSIDDIELQASDLEKKQKEYDSGVTLIKAECEDAGFLADSYIRELQYKSAMEIILEIKSDKKKAAELVNKDGSVTVGKEVDELQAQLEVASTFEEEAEEYRTRVLEVQYLPSQAKLMSEFFKKNNIKYKFVK